MGYVTVRELDGSPDPGALNVEELRSHLLGVLPDYMVPSAFVVLESLPLTPNGKVDRRALPAPDQESYARREYEAPQGELEVALAGIWQELLGVERVGRQDNFFELGGHSLLVVQLLARVRQVLARELSLQELFEAPTIRGLARQLSTASLVQVAPIEPADRSRDLRPSWSQERLWFIDQLEGGGAAYHIPGAVRLRGELDERSLRAALDTLVMRHEVLRTVFESVDGTAVQRIASQGSFALQSLDLSGSDLRGA